MPDETRSQLLDGGIATPPCGQQPIQFVDIFPNTPDRKVHLYPEDLDTLAPEGLYSYQEDPATDKYPLALISPASEKTISSMLGQLRTRTASLFMHPQDAAARELVTRRRRPRLQRPRRNPLPRSTSATASRRAR